MAQTGGAGFGSASGRVRISAGTRARTSRRPYEGRCSNASPTGGRGQAVAPTKAVAPMRHPRAGEDKPSPLRRVEGAGFEGIGGFLVLSPQSSHLLAVLQELL